MSIWFSSSNQSSGIHKLESSLVIDPDCSQYCVDAVLQQYFMGPDRKLRLYPIAYESKKLTETEHHYSSQERELLAEKYVLDHWRYIIEGSEMQIRNDHQILRVYPTKNDDQKTRKIYVRHWALQPPCLCIDLVHYNSYRTHCQECLVPKTKVLLQIWNALQCRPTVMDKEIKI